MKRFWALALAALAATAGVDAQQVDMQAVMLWSKAKVARFHVVGVYDKRTVIARGAGNYAQGDVTDGLTLDFDWNIHDNMVVGDVKLQNDTAKLGQLASVAANCRLPRPMGAYEHFTASKVRSSDGARIEVDGTRHYPDVEVAGCEADQSYKLVAAADEPLTEFVAVPNPMMLAVPGASAGGGNAVVAADRKSFTVKSNGWTWTYTPTPLP